MEGIERFLSPVKHPFITTSIDPLESSAGNNVFLNPFDGKRWITMVKCKDTETSDKPLAGLDAGWDLSN